MRIGVISDTHHELDIARKVIKKMGKIDMLIHAGDHLEDAYILGKEFKIPVKAVTGNCDYKREGKEEELVEINEDLKIFITHGHRYGVKRNLQNLYYKGLEKGAKVIVFGHTHVPVYLKESGIHILNPGSIGYPRGDNCPSYAVIDINEKFEINLKKFE